MSVFRNVYLFKDLTESEIAKVETIAKTESHLAGTELFSEGDSATALYFLKFGSVKIQHSGKNDSVNVATLGTGAHFGEMSFIDGEPRSATVTVIEPTETITLDFARLRQLFDQEPVIAKKVYRSMSLYLCGRLRLTTTDLSFARELAQRRG
jgi:CRP-like cAMP-binding protein